jgi:hypothetical protein
MTTVSATTLIAGAFVILVALWIQASRKEITATGIVLAMVGFILMTSQSWSTIVVDPGSGKVELKQIAVAAAAADDVAAQVEVLAGEVSGIKTQLIDLAALLRTGQNVSPDAARQIETRLSRMPVMDRSKLSSARATLGRVRNDISRIPAR